VYGDKGYTSGTRKHAADAAGVLWAVKEKATPGHRLTVRQRARNRRFGKVRAKVEHVFRVVKCQFGYRRVRYRGLTKNARAGILAARRSPTCNLAPQNNCASLTPSKPKGARRIIVETDNFA